MIALVLCLGLLQAPAARTDADAPAVQSSPQQAPAASARPPAETAPPVEGKGAPSFSIPRLDELAVIDGRLDEPAWSQAARLGGFSEYQPVDSQPASERTEVLVWYSPKALHVGVIAHDSVPGSVRATVADRDNIANDDWVRVYLDTFNDRRRAFIFGVNPLGVQEDGVQTEGGFSAGMTRGASGGGMYGGNFMSGQVDLSPDYQFDSKGRITDEGYVVEIRIPFKSLRYPAGGPMRWGVNVHRKTQRTGRQDTWTDAKRVASFLAQAGTMEGLHDLQRGVVTELQPFVTGSVDGAKLTDGRFAYAPTDLEAGANLRFGFTNLSLDATVNPDFSQVETDATQVTVNERFALFYPEKRPFFLEGIELFATPNQLVYTRQIADPIAGGKLTGKVGKTGVAFLSAPDDTGDSSAWFNIARLRQDVGKDSLAGLTYTDRTTSVGFNRVVAADARIVFKKLYYVLAQAGGSWTERDGETVSAPMWQAEFDRTARTFGFNYKLTGFGERFETQSGYVPRNNIVEGRASNRLTYYGARGAAVESFSGFLSVNGIWDYAGFGQDGAVEGGASLNLNGVLRGGWSTSLSTSRNFVRFDPDMYAGFEVLQPGGGLAPFAVPESESNWSGTYSLTTPVFQRFNAGISVSYGGTPIYAEASDGRQSRTTASLTVRPAQSMRIEGSLAATRITRERDGTEYAQSTIPRVKLEYQPRRSFFLRLVTEYRFEQRDALYDPVTGWPLFSGGAPISGQESNGLRADVLVSFEPTPGTVAFFGYGTSLAKDPLLYMTPGYTRTTDGFFVKLAYVCRK
ncbi:MAG TPA: DUF5916 domain-containing protein [Vicinamibacterales bacterium]|nr:DUF5916 domain-containing protein [Vicinamibacterales bacterium]